MAKIARLMVPMFIGVASFISAHSTAASGPIPYEDALCRSQLYAGTGKLARDTVKQLAKCHSQRLRGSLPPGTDCNDPANAPAPSRLERDADSIRDRAERRCENGASPHTVLGYLGCPQPCDGIMITSYANVAECLICFATATSGELSEEVLGTPSAPSGNAERKCQDRIGRALASYMSKRLTVQRRCQFDQDRGKIGPVIDCEAEDTDGRVAAALLRLQKAIAGCDPAALAQLDSCGSTIATEQACVPAASDEATGDLFDLVYYPGQIIFTPTPTITPTVTNTPTITLTPTIPLTPTPTHTFDPNAIEVEMDFVPGGGTTGTCSGTCAGGVADGDPCTSSSQCRVCAGGSNVGQPCVVDVQCPESTCQTIGASTCDASCVGGPYDGTACNSAPECSGCNPNNICTAAGVPLACCTGNDSGNCPVVGSCTIVQNPLFAVRVSMNGVCAPRVAPDVRCVTDAECDPGEICDYGSMTLSLAAPDPNGVAPILVQQASFEVPPSVVAGIGTICLLATDDGHGFVDCDGGASGVDWRTSQDHNTTPNNTCLDGTNEGLACTSSSDCPGLFSVCIGSSCAGGLNAGMACTSDTDCPDLAACNMGNSGSGSGLPDDPTCSNSFVLPGGFVSYACEEGTEQCVSGVNAGMVCTMDSECPGSTCEPCNQGGFHPGVCNSPVNVVESGTFATDDLEIAIPIAIQIMVAPAEFGPDQLACTGDDTPSEPPEPALFRFSTGLNAGEIFDAGNTSGSVVDSSSICGVNTCVAEVDGNPVACVDLVAGDLGGLVLGAAITQIDTPAGDIVTTIRLEALP